MAEPIQIQRIAEKSRKMRHHIVDMIGCEDGKVGHLGGSSSICDVVAALYFYKMKTHPDNPQNHHRDYFLLSKGHAALVQYAALAELGYFPLEELRRVKTLGSILQGHPDRTKTPGVEANTGSLGMGLSIGLGIALGLKLDKKENMVYVVIGDGELAEGQIWEAAMAAASFKSDNLVAIVDRNRIQATGAIADRMDIGDVKYKWEAFGWRVLEIDGHNIREICEALDSEREQEKPTMILANTVKGKYISFAENNAAFHNGGLSREQYEQAHSEIDSYMEVVK